MGELFRCEEMKLAHLFFQFDAAHDVLDELGELGIVQFRDVCVRCIASYRNRRCLKY
jgi:vacuolar-type H+-ATPase subunit I/STV1